MNATNGVADPARAKAWADLEADLMLNDPPVAVYARLHATGVCLAAELRLLVGR